MLTFEGVWTLSRVALVVVLILLAAALKTMVGPSKPNGAASCSLAPLAASPLAFLVPHRYPKPLASRCQRSLPSLAS